MSTKQMACRHMLIIYFTNHGVSTATREIMPSSAAVCCVVRLKMEIDLRFARLANLMEAYFISLLGCMRLGVQVIC